MRSIFRTVAVAEAFSWAGLLIAMFFKYVVQDNPNSGIEGGVPVMGMIHGVIFISYVISCFLARKRFAWNLKTTVIAIGSSIPPFCSYLFEVLADKRGLIGAPSQVTS